MQHRLLHRPFALRISVVPCRLRNGLQQLERRCDLRRESLHDVAIRHLRDVAIVIRVVFVGGGSVQEHRHGGASFAKNGERELDDIHTPSAMEAEKALRQTQSVMPRSNSDSAKASNTAPLAANGSVASA